ncbi:uncharacterized protein [Branchiostoma lanceolatum]|uniref:uncharacterized protein n=1 Tax=Branchiostoma lanceolatum TaxID=7740 RepID=UPI0034569363
MAAEDGRRDIMSNVEGDVNHYNSPTQVVEDHTGLLVLGNITDDVSMVAPTVRMPASYPPPPFSVEIRRSGDRVEYVLLDRLGSVAVRPDGAVRAPPHMKILTAHDIGIGTKQAIDDVLRNILYGPLTSGVYFQQLRKRTTLQGTQWVVLSHDHFTLSTGSVLVARVDSSGALVIETKPKENFSGEASSDLTRDERALVQKIITALLQGVPSQLLHPGIPSANVGQDQVFDDEQQVQEFFLRRIYGENPAVVPNGVCRRGRHDIDSRIRKIMCEHSLSWEAAERIVTSLDQWERQLD